MKTRKEISMIYIVILVIMTTFAGCTREYCEDGITVIGVAGWELEYTASDRTLTVEDFEDIELGSSLDEIQDMLGEPDGWVGAGILSPVYVLADRSAVELVFADDATDEDLEGIYHYKEEAETVIKKR